MFELDIVKPLAIITINEVKRLSRFDIYVYNITICKASQVDKLIGKPTPFKT